MNNTKFYLVPEDELRSLIEDRINCEMGWRDCMENWEWYQEIYEETARKFYPYPNPKNLELSFVADAYMKHRYHEMPVIIFPPEKDYKND